MVQNIENKIKIINQTIDWIKENRPNDFDQKFIMLVDERRKLRQIYKAASEKPAIAAFGESQKGKSYLMGNLLQNDGRPFMVKFNNGKEKINFIESINPIGDKKEATGVVTRFTTFNGDTDRYSESHPVIVKLLSPTSIATILCDTYHKDIMDYETYSDDEIKVFSQKLLEKYAKQPEVNSNAISEDDILEIKSYLSKYLTETQGLRRSNYFENLARVIRKVPVDEWVNVFGYLWHENDVISAIFSRMIRVLQRLRFTQELYTDIETVRHHGDNTNTIMSVDCLNGLDDPNWDRKATVYIKEGDGFVAINDILKCELAAVCAETIYKVEREYVEDEMPYNIYDGDKRLVGDLPQEAVNKLKIRSVKKTLLGVSDLLDFPGARNRLRIQQAFLANINPQNGASNAVQMLLRGKVAYLFNSYNEARIINILLFCHDAEAIVVNEMYIWLNDWVKKYVGDTPEKRAHTVIECGGIPPLFNICTKFNIDMVENGSEEKNNDAALNQRWSGRLKKVLYTQAFKANDVDWFRNWTGKDEGFKNSYLLRDFKYSGCTGYGNNLWRGYIETDINPTEKQLNLSATFYERMRKSFIGNTDVIKFFRTPDMAWDLAATRNNDGSLYIIENLNIVAHNASKARKDLFDNEIKIITNNVKRLIEGYYVSTDTDAILEANVQKALSIFREFDFTCNSDNYFFGHLLQALQIPEHESYKEVHKIMQSPELIDTVNAFKDYEIIRNSCKKRGYPLEDSKSEDEKWDCLIMTYGMADKDDALQYLERKGIDKDKLFSISYKRKLNSCIIADALFEKWCSRIKSDDFLNKMTSESGFDTGIMGEFVDAVISTAKAIHIPDRLAETIAEYVNVVNIHTANEYLLADILADVINDYLLDFGYSWLSEEEKGKAEKLCNQYKLTTLAYIKKENKGLCNEDELTELFDELSYTPKALLPSFEDNYNRWLEYMFISFVAHLEVPDFDKEANDRLKQLLDEIIVNPEIKV